MTEKEIQSHLPIPFWSIKAVCKLEEILYEVKFEIEKIDTKTEADKIVKECNGKTGVVKDIELKKSRQMPPIPFDVGGLQTEAYKIFRFTPSRTLGIAEKLYLKALISYPRTSSQKLPPIINYREILTLLSHAKMYRPFANELLTKKVLRPYEGEKEDPAHPAIYPTGTLPDKPLESAEQKIFDLVVRRFMAVFGEPALKQTVKVTIKVADHTFYLYGRRTVEDGWLKYYSPYVKSDEIILPPIEIGQKVPLETVTCEDKFTAPPPRYNPSSLLKLMEDQAIGTKATRAEIIDILFDRNYIKDMMLVTDLGFYVIDTLEKYCKGIISVELTRELEEKMKKIEAGEEERENVLADAIGKLKPLLEEFKSREREIGKELSEAIQNARLQERTIGTCPVCGTGKLLILRSRRTLKQFIGCSNFFEHLCNAGFPLPQKAIVKPLRRSCTICQWPMVLVRIYGRHHPWNLCFNPNCPAKRKMKKIVPNMS